jgi:hypothetical protein
MPSFVTSLVSGIRSIVWRIVPTPQSIELSVVRGGGVQIDIAGVAAGATRTWRDTIAAVEDSVLVVIAQATIEHGTLGLGAEPDTNVELTVSVDGARIGRALVSLRQGEANVLNCTASIRVAAGVRRVSAVLHPYDAGVKVGDHSVVSLCVPETMASIATVS